MATLRALFFTALVTWAVSSCHAVVVNSLLVPAADVPAGAKVELNWLVANPTEGEARAEIPTSVKGTLIVGERRWPVHLALLAGRSTVVPARSFVYNSYAFDVPADAEGLATLELDAPWSIRAALRVIAAAPAPVSGAPAAAEPTGVVPAPMHNAQGEAAVSRFQRAFTDRFATHQPIYFIFGPDKPAAKFQFSFKYRVLSDHNALNDRVPALKSLFFGYTQRSIWDITSKSSPFYDTSYMPEIFFEDLAPRQQGGLGEWLGFQVGVQHESNGRDGAGSRSMNVAYVRPMFALGTPGSWAVVFAPKILYDIDNLSDNSDLRRYRGFVEYSFIVTKNDHLSLSATARIGKNWDKGSVQVDLNYPLRVRYGNFATFLVVQYFDGYGESLLSYNQSSRMIRAGFGLVR